MSRFAAMLLTAGLGILMLGACSTSAQRGGATICDKSQRTALLSAEIYGNLDEPAKTSPFTITNGFAAWLQVTKDDQSDRLFGNLTAVADLYSIPSGATPNVATESNGFLDPKDPRIIVDKALVWQKLPLKAGSWQLYTFQYVGIELVACPTG